MEHAGGIRRGVASICDKSFDLISILGKVDVGSKSYIVIKMVFFEKHFLKIDLSQTALPKMTATTIGWYQVFCEKTICLDIYYSNLGFPGKPWSPFFLIIESFHKEPTLCGFLYFRKSLGRTLLEATLAHFLGKITSNKPSNTLLKATGNKNQPAASPSTLKLG